MAMVVKNNMSAVRTLNTLNGNTNALQKSLQKVSSGMKINSAQDDASGYAISERMRVRIRSLDQANQNTQNDASLMKTAEGAVGNTVEILRALKEKAINAANDSNTDEDRQTIQKEINQFIDQIDDNALVQFNGKYLIDGSKNNATVSSKTILLNQSLKAGTLETDALTSLRNRAGDSLGIQTSDKWQVSWVENGNITFASGTVGDKSLAKILSNSWTTDGKEFGQVAATTNDGLISSAEPVDKFVKFGTYKEADTLPAGLEDLVKASDAYKKDQALGTPVGGSISLTELGIYKDDEGGEFASTIGVKWLANGGVTSAIEGIDAAELPVTLYQKEVVEEAPPVTESTVKLSDISATITGTGTAAASDNFANDPLGKELVATGKLDVELGSDTIPGGGTLPKTATMKLSDLGKYYLKTTDDEFVPAGDVTVTRTKTFGWNGSDKELQGDVISFELANGDKYGDGTTAATKDTVKIYELAGGGTGFTDAWDKFGKAVYTPDKTAGIAVASTGDGGVNGQLSGLTISILDQDGNVKKAANAALDQFKQYQRAENQTGDMSLNFHIGSEANVAIKVGMSDMRSEALGLKGSDGTRIDVFTKEHANSAINVIENALTKALDQQTTIGAIEARLEYTSTNLTTSSENVQAAESTIRDADMAKEMTNYTKSNVLLQAAQAMLAQANQNSSAVLSLLQ